METGVPQQEGAGPLEEISADTREKLAAMDAQLRAHAPLVVAYSGGVDSAFLLAHAFRVLGEGVLGVIADSPSLPRQALADALALAHSLGVPVEVLQTFELDQPEYTANPVNRCYFCKAELFSQLERLATERRFRAVAYGENWDDMRSVRPGRKAAEEFAVLAPLRDSGLSKREIRQLSAELGLPTADAPAQPCLSSRIPHGTPVTEEALRMVEKGEAFVRSLGFRVFRVRHLAEPGQGARARLQVAPEEMGRLREVAAGVLEEGLVGVGYRSVEVDPMGYRAS
jgi:uncharacterized protein